MMAFSHVQMTKLYVRERSAGSLPEQRVAIGPNDENKKVQYGFMWQSSQYETFTNSHLSTTACSFNPTDSPYIHSNFNLAAKAIKALPNRKIILDNGQLINDWWTVYTKPRIIIVNDDENWSIPRVVDVCFCLVSVLSIYFYCVTYLHKNVFHDKNAAPSYNGSLLRRRRFFCPHGGRYGEFPL